jgi:hypothetical protein
MSSHVELRTCYVIDNGDCGSQVSLTMVRVTRTVIVLWITPSRLTVVFDNGESDSLALYIDIQVGSSVVSEKILSAKMQFDETTSD